MLLKLLDPFYHLDNSRNKSLRRKLSIPEELDESLQMYGLSTQNRFLIDALTGKASPVKNLRAILQENEAAASRRDSLKYALRGGLGIALVATGLSFLMQPEKYVLLTDVPEQDRQQFLDEIVDVSEIPYCDAIVYDEDGSKLAEYLRQKLEASGLNPDEVQKTLDFNKHFTGKEFSLFTVGRPKDYDKADSTRIFVGKQAFDPTRSIRTVEDLRSAILFHEGHHCKIYGEGFEAFDSARITQGFKDGKIRNSVKYAAEEVEIIYHERRKISNVQGLSQVYKQLVFNNFKKYIVELMILGSNPKSPLEKEFIETTLEKYSQ